jgi:predicted small metal-binding protein
MFVTSVASKEAVMKALHCGDLMEGCDFVARGNTEDEVMAQAAEHARTAHGMDRMPSEVVEEVKAAIRTE